MKRDFLKNLGIEDKEIIDKILANTHSCYDPIGDQSCGRCGTCKERLEAFEENSIVDPIKYMV